MEMLSPMDPNAHNRFLEYLDTWLYFREPGEQRLDAGTWRALDAELDSLERAEAADLKRVRMLRRKLMRD